MAETSTYEIIPYESYPYDYSHPDHLATISQLFGLVAPQVRTCRVLELGCASGGNLIPMAMALPEAQFFGVDRAQRQVREGQIRIDQLKLNNIRLDSIGIETLSPEIGEFDYILCHGVYSWVKPEVQEAILATVERHLAPNGVAYVSYNTYPGWFLRGMVRQMMRFHVRPFDEPEVQVKQARAFLDFLIHANSGSDPVFQSLLNRELEILRTRHDSYLYHEHLETDNEPLFFYQFMERASQHGLRYLGEALFAEMVPSNVSQKAADTLRELKVDLIHSEQYLDFLRNRTFRRTLLCRHAVELTRQLGPKQLEGMFVISAFTPVSQSPNWETDAEEGFRLENGIEIRLSSPLEKCAILALAQAYPMGIRFDELPRAAETALGQRTLTATEEFSVARNQLASMVYELYSKGLAELRVDQVRFSKDAGEKPTANPLSRLQAESGAAVTTLRHTTIPLNDWERQLISRLDGSFDLSQLRQWMQELIATGQLVIEPDAEASSHQTQQPTPADLLEETLERFARQGLFARNRD